MTHINELMEKCGLCEKIVPACIYSLSVFRC